MSVAYPTAADLAAYLTSLGIVASDVAMDALNLSDKASAIKSEWERLTKWKPFLAATQTRYFDAPGIEGGTNWGSWSGGRRRLFLGAGLLSITSVTINLSATDTTGLVRVLNTDYWLRPQTATYEGEPYTYIEFQSPVYGFPNSVKVIGSWGYATDIPGDVFEAMKQYGAFLAYPELAIGLSKGLYKTVYGDETEQFGGGAGHGALSTEAAVWEKRFLSVVKRYQRPVVV